MPRKNLTGTWGEHRGLSVRLTAEDRRAIRKLRERWGLDTAAAVVRRALRERAAAGEAVVMADELRQLAQVLVSGDVPPEHQAAAGRRLAAVAAKLAPGRER